MITGNKRNARARMAKLLSSEAIQARIARLNVNTGEFCADVMEAYMLDEQVALLNENEVFAVLEMAGKLNIRFGPRGDARLIAVRGRAALAIGFPGLYALHKNSARAPEA